MARVPMRRPLALVHFAFLLLAACTVGPDFAVPIPPEVPLTPGPPPPYVSADGKVQRFVHGRDIPGEWWRLFRSKELTDLIERALRDNHDLKAVQAALRVAHANYRAQLGALFPVIGANVSSSDQKASTSVLSSPTISGDPFYTLQTGQLTISYVPDVFGGIRRQVETAAAQEESQRFALEAAYLTLTSNIALAAIQEASLKAQIEATKEAIEHEKLLYGNQDSRDAFSNANPRDWAALKSAIGQAEQTVPLLQKQLAAQRDLLTALTGHFAGEGLRETFTLYRRESRPLYRPESRPFLPKESRLSLPKDLPLMLSSQIVEQRPDVRAAQANLHAAGALVGVAIANRLPLFNISGNVGRSGSQFSDLLNPAPPFLFWTAAGSVTQTIFDGFTLEQRQRAAEAGWDQTAEQYRSTVVNAFQNVADALQAIKFDAESVRKARDAEDAARQNLCMTAAAFVGYQGDGWPKDPILNKVQPDDELEKPIKRAFVRWWTSVCMGRKGIKAVTLDPNDTPTGIDLLTSEQLLLSTRLSRIAAEASRYADVVALFQALGGGWWNRSDVEEARDPSLFGRPEPSHKQ
jgi:NodT family efflux transporter outer membrane factor (OMF) lipoprotein